MMTAMRENMPLIMWILVGAFLATIVFSWGMGGFKGSQDLDGVIGRIGTREILYDQYNKIVQDRLARLRQENENTQITEAQIRQTRKEVWDELIRNEVMDVYAEKWGLRTSDAEVAWAVKNSPPNWLRENEAFQKDGHFDLATYDQFLRDPRSADILVAIETDYRTSLAHQKVVDRVIAPVFVSDDEAFDDFLATNRRFSVAVVSFLPRNFEVDTASITDAQISDHYTSHRSDFLRPELRKLAYVSFPIMATQEDSNRVIETASEVVGRAKGGEDFADLAADFSEDEGSAKTGGDLGYFTSGRMVPEFDSAAFHAQPGEFVGPVLTRFGAHVIQVLDRKTAATGDSVHARHILLKWNVGSDTEARIAQRAKDFTDAAKQDGWKAAAEAFKLEVQETD
ncbi:MAG: SurA N-terminal domain-containing protein, partial [bacterium]|nr:SurA N-terminal domain-containing protein [bacterium]